MKKVLESDDIPEVGKNVMDSRKACEFCEYAKARTQLTLNAVSGNKKLSRSLG
jgi:hypothetical protein